MRASPFLDDPRDLLTSHIALAVAAPMEELAAMHIRAAEHHAELARANGLDLPGHQSPTVRGSAA